jgi:hypothetical protein
MLDNLQVAAAQRARAALDVLIADPRAPRFSIVRAVMDLTGGQKLTGAELEFQQEAARVAHRNFDAGLVFIPWSYFGRRDLTVSVAPSGGYLVETELSEARDILRPWSITVRAGLTIIDQLEGNTGVTITGSTATGYWLSSEQSQITTSTPGLKQIPMVPKTAGGIVNASRLFMLQTRGEAYIRRELLRTLGNVVDKAVLNGSGTSGQPVGIINVSGIGTQSGTTLGHAGVAAMKRKVADSNAPDEAISFIGTTAVRELLETRERATGSGFVWDNDRVASRPAYATTDMPSATLVCGTLTECLLGMWGDGFEFSVNPFDPTGFKIGTSQVRVVIACDTAVPTPAAFCVASSIT